jgi:phenylalanyl-tRNA synthetase beta chain
VGRVFCADRQKYPEERQEINIVLSGQRHPERFSAERDELFDFYDLKGLVESLLELRHIKGVRFNPVTDGKFDYATEIACGDRVIGVMGRVDQKFAREMKAKNPLFMAVIQVDELFKVKVPVLYYEAVSQFPATARDIAFVAPEKLTHSEVVDFISRSKLKSLEKIELFDIFRDEKALGTGKKSMAYSLTFRHPERTLTDEEVNSAMERLRERLGKELQVELR